MTERIDTDKATGDDWLDRALAEDGRAHRSDYLADDGFTARVAATLPAPSTLPAWRAPAVAALWTITAVAVAFALPAAVSDALLGVAHMAATHRVTLIDVAGGLAAFGMASWVATAWVLRRSG